MMQGYDDEYYYYLPGKPRGGGPPKGGIPGGPGGIPRGGGSIPEYIYTCIDIDRVRHITCTMHNEERHSDLPGPPGKPPIGGRPNC